MCYIKKNKDGGIEANLSIFTFEEDGIVHVYCPSLDMFGYDGTAKLLDGEDVFAQIRTRYGLKA